MSEGFEFPCCVEYAKSDRSSCVKCGSQILKSEIRIGQQYDRDHSSYRWYHLECYQYAKNFPKKAKTAEEFLFGYERITSIDQKRVARSMEKAIYHRDHGGAHHANGHHALDDSEGSDLSEAEEVDDDEKRPIKKGKKPSKGKQQPPSDKKEKYREKEKEKEKEKEVLTSSYSAGEDFFSFNSQQQQPNYDYGIPSSSSENAFVGFYSSSSSTNPLDGYFLGDKENDTSFLNTNHSNNQHQVFASSPLKPISSSSSHSQGGSQNVQSFLNGFAHRLPRRHIDWLLNPTMHVDKVKRAVEAAQTVYQVDGDEEDLIDTLERVFTTLGGNK